MQRHPSGGGPFCWEGDHRRRPFPSSGIFFLSRLWRDPRTGHPVGGGHAGYPEFFCLVRPFFSFGKDEQLGRPIGIV